MMHETFGLDPWCDWCDAHLDPAVFWVADADLADLCDALGIPRALSYTAFCSAECAAHWGCATYTPRMVNV